ncbi:MAG: epimerase, partial [Gammaproteobacteria bacterium]|nr:epimerase [Gammaproteobacteria bacterium]
SYTMGRLLEDSQAILDTSVDPVWVSDEFVEESEAAAGGALPIWHPVGGEFAHVSSVSGERARRAGLHNRPVRETLRDLMAWWDTLPEERIASARFAMTAERETELIAAWKANA